MSDRLQQIAGILMVLLALSGILWPVAFIYRSQVLEITVGQQGAMIQQLSAQVQQYENAIKQFNEAQATARSQE